MRPAWGTFRAALKRFSEIEGTQRAGAFAYYAVFSLFPLVILSVTTASFFIDRDRAAETVMKVVADYVPITGEMSRQIFDALSAVVASRGEAGLTAFLMLVWSSSRFFTTLVSSTHRAWGTRVKDWWSLPLESIVLLGVTIGTVFLGMAASVAASMADRFFAWSAFHEWAYGLAAFFIPLSVIFVTISIFYKVAPRQRRRFSEVWGPALLATFFLKLSEEAFVIYLTEYAALPVYGTFGGAMALLLWIYISGRIFILGACLCAVRVERALRPAGPPPAGGG